MRDCKTLLGDGGWVQGELADALDDFLAQHEEARKNFVSRDCFEKILAENDTARAQLASISKHIGDDMSDVGKVYRTTFRLIRPSRGEPKIHCNNCKNEYDADMWMGKLLYSFCPYCGAKMDGCDEAPTNPIKGASDGVMPCW